MSTNNDKNMESNISNFFIIIFFKEQNYEKK